MRCDWTPVCSWRQKANPSQAPEGSLRQIKTQRVRPREFTLLLLLDQKPAYRHLQLCHLVVLKTLSPCLFRLSVPPVWTSIWRGLWRYQFAQQGPCKAAASARQALLKSLSQILIWKKSAELQCHQESCANWLLLGLSASDFSEKKSPIDDKIREEEESF